MEDETRIIKPKSITPPGKGRKEKPRKKRRRGGIVNLLLLIGIISAVGLFIWAEQQRRDALSQLQETEQQLEEIRESTQRSGQAVADEVLSKITKHIDIPLDPQPTVATIIDIERLRETNDFYKNADNGDHLVLTEQRAILYDPDRDVIIDVVPVVINPEDQPGEAPEGEDTAPAGEQPADQGQPGTGETGTQTQPVQGGQQPPAGQPGQDQATPAAAP